MSDMNFLRAKNHLINLNHVIDIRYNDGTVIQIVLENENRIPLYYSTEPEAAEVFESISRYLALNGRAI